MIRNIQECVAERVIAHMQYRDKEIEEMREALESNDVIKCNFCHKWKSYDWTCEFCDQQSCTDCRCVKKYQSWNLSGCHACDECEKIYCTDCRNLKTQCERLPICAK